MLLTLVNYMFFPIAMKLWWVFGFVVSFITFFLMTFYKHERDKLKETIFIRDSKNKANDVTFSEIENSYKALITNLKVDQKKIQEEVKLLECGIMDLSKRREDLKHDVLKQQEEYQTLIASFTEDLEARIDAFKMMANDKLCIK